VGDPDDNCPNTFNPVLPFTRGAQPDSDGDGQGDACDPTPLSGDIDGDMVANGEDNCPFDSNGPQDDGDGDEKGDVCDFCPEAANPDTVCSEQPGEETTIPAIQMGMVAEDTRVTLRGVIVTGVWAEGIWVQTEAGGPHSGVNVYVGDGFDGGVSLGDVVDVEGKVAEYYEDTQVADAVITPRGMSLETSISSLTVSEARDEAYEGVLVRLTNAVLSAESYDCSVDNDRCSDENLWEVNDGSSAAIVVFDRVYEASDWETTVGELPVTGVMSYRFDRRRILPRSRVDLGQ
jgi:hypothetical protein